MTTDQMVYLVFGVVVVTALILDLGFLSKKNTTITIRQALQQTFIWVLLALGFFVFMWIEEGQKLAFEYLSGYLMEWSLSIDNIFVFILIFDAFKVKEQHLSRVLLIGILIAILLPFFWTALLGFCLVGFGTAAIFPMTFALAGTSKKYSPGMAIAIISTFGIVGMFIGPPLIGYLAHAFGLQKAFLIFVVGGFLIIPISRLFFKIQAH